jgi:hypothetical protein
MKNGTPDLQSVPCRTVCLRALRTLTECFRLGHCQKLQKGCLKKRGGKPGFLTSPVNSSFEGIRLA